MGANCALLPLLYVHQIEPASFYQTWVSVSECLVKACLDRRGHRHWRSLSCPLTELGLWSRLEVLFAPLAPSLLPAVQLVASQL